MKDKGFRKPWNWRWAIQRLESGMCVELKESATIVSDIAKVARG